MTYRQSKGINKNYWPWTIHALLMVSHTLWWLPKLTHYGALLSRRWSTSLHLEPTLVASILFKQAKLSFDQSAF